MAPAAQPRSAGGLPWRGLLFLLLVLPWLNPFASGPSPAVVPWLVSAVCALLVWVLPGRLDAGLMASAVLVAALLSAMMAVLQYFGAAGALSPWVNMPEAGQAYGNLRQRNQFASLMSMGLIAWVYLGSGKAWRPHAWWILGLLGLGLACSGSRTGLVQWLLVWLLVMSCWKRNPPQRTPAWVGYALLVFAIAAIALPTALRGIAGIEAAGLFTRLSGQAVDCTSRITLWANVLHLIAQRPWAGWGWGELDYAHYITLYPGERFCEILDNAHNLPLHLAVELGLPVAILSCALLLGWVIRARPWAETRPGHQMAWAWLAVLAVHSLLEYPLWYGPFQLATLWSLWQLSAGAGWATPAPPGASSADSPASRYFSAARWSGAATGLALCAYAAWDYHRVSQIFLLPAQRSEQYQTDTLLKIQSSVLFRRQVEFAELATTPLNRATSERIYLLSSSLLHFSPEARVVERLVESAIMLGRLDDARFHLLRFRQAFPQEHARWSAALARRSSARAARLASAPD